MRNTTNQALYRIALSTSRTILSRAGVIRGLTNWGQFDLPRPTTKHQTQHFQGHYFILRFDSAAAVQNEIKRTLRLDPRMIQFSVTKVADKLGGRGVWMEGVESAAGKIRWEPADSLLDTLNVIKNGGGMGLRS
jgi:small subunit ribosomal protein S6